jgi:hypothetical protein
MPHYTYTVLYCDAEVACCEGATFEYCRETALAEVPAMYPREDLMFESTCDSGVLYAVSGPCYP